MTKWAVHEELVLSGVYEAPKTVAWIREEYSQVKEQPPIEPVATADNDFEEELTFEAL